MTKKILIAGGTGFIGYHLAKKCKNIGWTVFCLSRNRPKKNKKINGVKYINTDLEKKIIKPKKSFDYVVNLAGNINNNSKEKYKNNHLRILKNLINFFDNSYVKVFLQLGTSLEYGKINSPNDEKKKCFPISKYGKDKLKCTNFLLNLNSKKNFPVTIFRVYQAYGPIQGTNRLIPLISKSCIQKQKFKCSDGKQFKDFIYIDDLVSAILKALKSKNSVGEIFNVGTGKKTSIKYIINYIQNYYKGGKPEFGAVKLRKDENKIMYPSVKKIKSHLNWKPKINIKYGLEKTLKSFENQIL